MFPLFDKNWVRDFLCKILASRVLNRIFQVYKMAKWGEGDPRWIGVIFFYIILLFLNFTLFLLLPTIFYIFSGGTARRDEREQLALDRKEC
jgi:hypothetical protein